MESQHESLRISSTQPADGHFVNTSLRQKRRLASLPRWGVRETKGGGMIFFLSADLYRWFVFRSIYWLVMVSFVFFDYFFFFFGLHIQCVYLIYVQGELRTPKWLQIRALSRHHLHAIVAYFCPNCRNEYKEIKLTVWDVYENSAVYEYMYSRKLVYPLIHMCRYE